MHPSELHYSHYIKFTSADYPNEDNDPAMESASCDFCRKFLTKNFLPNHLLICKKNDNEKAKKAVKAPVETFKRSGEEVFECDECNKVFNKKRSKIDHVYSVHSQKIKCTFEDCRTVLKKRYLPEHIKNVHEKLKYRCGICGKEMLRSSLSNHSKICTNSQPQKRKSSSLSTEQFEVIDNIHPTYNEMKSDPSTQPLTNRLESGIVLTPQVMDISQNFLDESRIPLNHPQFYNKVKMT